MSSLDSSIVLIALPTIGRELPNTSPFDLIWVLVGYQLIISAVLVNFGRLSDIFGRVRLYTLGFAIFTASSALCSLSQSGTELSVFRMVQGVGAAFLFSNSAAILTDAFPFEERGKALGTNSIAIAVGSVMGLVLGGFLTSEAGWQSIFWINVPIGVVATIWSHYRLKELSVRRTGQRLDLPGNIAFAGGLGMVLAGISLDAVAAVSHALIAALIAGGLALLGAFVYAEGKVEDPMLNLSLFRNRPFTAGNFAAFLNSLARGCITLVLVFYLQGPNMGLSPLQAGVFLLPNTLTMAIFGPLSGWLSDKRGARTIATAGLLTSALGLVMLTQLPPSIGFWQLAFPLFLVGAGMGIFQSPNRASVMSSVEPEDRGLASGIGTTLMNLGMSISRSLAFVVMSLAVPVAQLDELFAGNYGASGASFVGNYVDGIHLVFYVSTVFILLSIVPSLMRGAQRRPQAKTETEGLLSEIADDA